MELKLNGSPVLILGAGKGLGKAMCYAFAKEGAIVSIVTRSLENLNACIETLSQVNPKSCGLMFQGDATEHKILEEVINKIEKNFGALKIGICNIGPTQSGDWNELEADDWLNSLKNNLYPFYYLCKYSTNSMKKAKYGVLINVGSISATQPGGISKPDHGFFKAGIYNFIKRLSNDLAQYNMRINMVSPGLIDPIETCNETVSQMLCHRLNMTDAKEAISFYCKDKIPMQRPASPEEIANIIVFMSSPVASYITGQNIIVDGGYCK